MRVLVLEGRKSLNPDSPTQKNTQLKRKKNRHEAVGLTFPHRILIGPWAAWEYATRQTKFPTQPRESASLFACTLRYPCELCHFRSSLSYGSLGGAWKGTENAAGGTGGRGSR